MLTDRKYTSGRDRYRQSQGLSGVGNRRVSCRRSFEFQYRVSQGGQSSAMIALEVKAFAAVGYGAHENSLMRAKIISRICLVQLFMKIAADRPDIKNSRREPDDSAAF